jgi:predicted Rossmann fold nucleotide-binding protein DprA/Smf involved in DNA uptake
VLLQRAILLYILLNKPVTLRVSSPRNAVGRFPLLARAGANAWLASRLSARVLRRLDSPDGVFRATLPDLESCHLPAQVAKVIVKKESFKRAEKELTGVQKIAGCYLLNWTEPEYPQTLLQIHDPPVLLYLRGDAQVLNLSGLSIVGTCRPTFYGTQMAQRLG